MNAQSLTVSVIIPTYNRAELVCTAIDSLLAQIRLPDEIIVVDDGSTDDTAHVLEKYASPVRVIQQPNAGRSAARNRGLDAASGDLIAFLDSDDYLLPESIAQRAKILEQQPELGAVYSDAVLVSPDQHTMGIYSSIYPTPRPSGKIFAELARRNFMPLPTVMFRRPASVLRFDVTMDLAEDYDFWLRLSATCTFHYIGEPLAAIRTPEGAVFTVSNWGLPGVSSENNPLRMKQSEIAVQERVMASTAFQQCGRLQRARILCSHGMKNRMIGRKRHAMRLFLKAILSAPYYPTGYGLLLLSLLGNTIFEMAILIRRRVIRLLDVAR